MHVAWTPACTPRSWTAGEPERADQARVGAGRAAGASRACSRTTSWRSTRTLDGSRLFFVSRGGNCVIQATLDANGQITLGVPGTVRYQTGNIPTGIAVSADGKRAYTYNEVGSR